MPSGTMAQQIVLRVHADRRNRRTVLYHPQCHLAVHELDAPERLHGLQGRAVGGRDRLIGIDDLRAKAGGNPPVAEAPAALLLELPQRDLGGQLPAWDDLVAQVEWARSVGAAAHMDGARLWQCAGRSTTRPLAAIAAPFDTVYVSFYKDIGAFAGAAVAGPADVIAEVREWRQRHGGTLYTMWPHAASALANLRARLPRMPRYREQALALADALRDLPGVQLVPDPPHGSMVHLVLHRDGAAIDAAALRSRRTRASGPGAASTRLRSRASRGSSCRSATRRCNGRRRTSGTSSRGCSPTDAGGSQVAGSRRPVSQNVSAAPLPLRSTRPRGSTTNRRSSRPATSAETWIRPGSDVVSRRLAMLTVSPQTSYANFECTDDARHDGPGVDADADLPGGRPPVRLATDSRMPSAVVGRSRSTRSMPPPASPPTAR